MVFLTQSLYWKSPIVESGFDAIVLYQVGTSDANSRLVFFIDESEGLPFTGTGESLLLTLQWNNEPGKILSL